MLWFTFGRGGLLRFLIVSQSFLVPAVQSFSWLSQSSFLWLFTFKPVPRFLSASSNHLNIDKVYCRIFLSFLSNILADPGLYLICEEYSKYH